jgi:hypothetical protein
VGVCCAASLLAKLRTISANSPAERRPEAEKQKRLITNRLLETESGSLCSKKIQKEQGTLSFVAYETAEAR